MKVRKSLRICLQVWLALILYIWIAPTMEDVQSMSGSLLAAIILSRIRMFAAIPLSAGVLFFMIGSCYFDRNRAHIPPISKKVRILFWGGFLLMALAYVYWTVGFVMIKVYPPMAQKTGFYIWQHRYLISLWCVGAAALLLCGLYCGKKER